MIIKDHKDNLNRELSLVEQKKMQWAKERDEMAKLEQYHSSLSSKYEKNTIRTQLITNTEIVQQNHQNNFHQKNFSVRRIRSPSLPPIEKTMTRQGSNNSDQSSGYLSGSGGGGGGNNSLPPNANNVAVDNSNPFDFKYGTTQLDNLNDKFQQQRNDHRSLKKLSLTSSINDYCSSSNHEQDMEFSNGHKSLASPSSETSSITSHDMFSMSSYANSSAIDSSMNYQKSQGGGRAKWGSYLFDSFSKDNGRSSRNTNGPVWLEKSLSEARDSEEETMSISVRSVASFLRGQNVPVDPQVLAERESKRRKAMELQQAIKNQLQERENFKKMEKEKQYQIDRMEEERLAKQMDLERKRLEYEQNLQYEKLEAERKREEAMRKALEKAALEAQMDRERKRRERVAMQNTVDETISIQKIGEKTEIIIDQKSTSGYESTVENHEIPQTPAQESDFDDKEDEDDGETVLIGTPIKLKKKNLDTFRRKFHKRQQNVEDSKNTSDDEVSTPKTAKSVESNNEKNQAKQTAKVLSELDGIALVLQSMPLPFVPLSNDIFGFNQLNNLALLMAAQNRLNSPNLMLPIISKDMTTTTAAINGSDKLDLSQFLMPQNNQQTITLQIQQVETKQAVNNDSRANIQSVPPTPDQQSREAQTSMEVKPIESVRSIPQTPSESSVQPTPTPLPHDGTFTKEECHKHDAFTSTSTENRFVDEEREVKILTPQKYRNETRIKENMKTISTQTESFLFCEYCSYQHQQHHQHQCSGHTTTEESDTNPNSIHAEIVKSKEKKSENRPLWGARNPPIKYLKASERDPFYGKNRKKRYLKKAASESEKTDDTCALRDCPLIKSSTPSLPKLSEKFSRDNLCKSMLPIKYDRYGNCQILMDPDNFVMHDAFRRIHKSELYASDCESSIDIKHKSFFLPKANDQQFTDIFVD